MSAPHTFALTLRAIRESRPRMGMPRLAGIAGLSQSTISRLESGERRPSRAVVERLATALRATPAERDALLVAAGYRAARDDDPTVATLALALTDPTIPAAHRERLRLAVDLLVQQTLAVTA